ncbi:hypothetical protein COV20_01310 [Candidatus Woesearchaeota archaeon CG10_big_fil_rev_8_21_14_0_10_45_16]|nr:MAG: hypothetical protein COV20_01310 [Candidatus Woesearchaeota archaeon CG10_big_fil_rev_8_21_14_0_10_45_16]
MKKAVMLVLVFFVLFSSVLAQEEEADPCSGFWGTVKCVLFGDPNRQALVGEAAAVSQETDANGYTYFEYDDPNDGQRSETVRRKGNEVQVLTAGEWKLADEAVSRIITTPAMYAAALKENYLVLQTIAQVETSSGLTIPKAGSTVTPEPATAPAAAPAQAEAKQLSEKQKERLPAELKNNPDLLNHKQVSYLDGFIQLDSNGKLVVTDSLGNVVGVINTDGTDLAVSDYTPPAEGTTLPPAAAPTPVPPPPASQPLLDQNKEEDVKKFQEVWIRVHCPERRCPAGTECIGTLAKSICSADGAFGTKTKAAWDDYYLNLPATQSAADDVAAAQKQVDDSRMFTSFDSKTNSDKAFELDAGGNGAVIRSNSGAIVRTFTRDTDTGKWFETTNGERNEVIGDLKDIFDAQSKKVKEAQKNLELVRRINNLQSASSPNLQSYKTPANERYTSSINDFFSDKTDLNAVTDEQIQQYVDIQGLSKDESAQLKSDLQDQLGLRRKGVLQEDIDTRLEYYQARRTRDDLKQQQQEKVKAARALNQLANQNLETADKFLDDFQKSHLNLDVRGLKSAQVEKLQELNNDEKAALKQNLELRESALAQRASAQESLNAINKELDAAEKKAEELRRESVERTPLTTTQRISNFLGAFGQFGALSNALHISDNKDADAVDKWFAGTVLSTGYWESAVCNADPQDLADSGAAFIVTPSGTEQPVASANGERIGGRVPLLCTLLEDPAAEEEPEPACPGELECRDDGFCYEEGKDVPAEGFLYRFSWGVTAPADEQITPYLDEDGYAIEFNIEVDGFQLYDLNVELKNGQSDKDLWAEYVFGDDLANREICIVWERAPQTYGELFTGQTDLPDVCNTIVISEEGTPEKPKRQRRDFRSTVSSGEVTRRSLSSR